MHLALSNLLEQLGGVFSVIDTIYWIVTLAFMLYCIINNVRSTFRNNTDQVILILIIIFGGIIGCIIYLYMKDRFTVREHTEEDILHL